MKPHIKTAVILAAGMGTRLRNVIGEFPKGSLEIDDKPIILHSLEKLKQANIQNIILVTGYQNNIYHDLLKNVSPNIQFVYNSDYSITGSMHSLFLANSCIQDDFLLLESDLIYESLSLKALLEVEHSDVILLSGRTNSGDEVYVYGQSNILEYLSKIPDSSLNLLGEQVGICKISFSLYQKMCSFYQTNIPFPSDYHYETCLSDLANQEKIHTLCIEDLAWAEIDNASHLNRVLNQVYPKIVAREK